ncbi:rhamnulokinase family protein [Amycolatopsis sp. 195334CR]|uniref:rhamnulokinase n=1 Tax=Amycolatopsis sp. 195334CR TaxID=2814588 RepID=UPI001A8D869C|nr:rhamnulokinase family protein [Amycolatopsis sp. 195334CR]MBN6040642.1 rhamnulokinase [Amycolatopsis sp. 195334CR]
MEPVFAAVDLGASSGRVVTGRFGDGTLELAEVHRFPNEPVTTGGTLRWNIRSLYKGLTEGLDAALARHGTLAGIGIDSWAVDYGLLDADGALLGDPVHYRDSRTAAGVSRVHSRVPAERLYATTGIQFQPFNTVFQLATEDLSPVSSVVLVPDLLSYWLTGELGTERTNASTTGLLDPRTGEWATGLFGELGLRPGLFPPLRDPGVAAGTYQGCPVWTVGSHDTASAVVAVPAEDDRFAYISCGTWSLVGLELDAPVLTEEAREANFTNERGVDGTVRFLRNVMGLWMLQEVQRDLGLGLGHLLDGAAEATPWRSVVDATDPRFLPPGGMAARITEACRDAGQPTPRDPGELARCVLDSLAIAYRDAVADAVRLSGRPVEAIHLVGGGAHNDLLCRLTAEACGLPVHAGPTEATAAGNLLVQARAAGTLDGGLQDLRRLLRTAHPPRTYRE